MKLSDLSKIDRSPVGFVVSPQVYEGLKAKMSPAPGELGFLGTPMVVDPNLPETAVDVAYTQEAWLERLAKIEK